MVEAPEEGEGPGERDQEVNILGRETFFGWEERDKELKKEFNNHDQGSSCKPHSGEGPLIEIGGRRKRQCWELGYGMPSRSSRSETKEPSDPFKWWHLPLTDKDGDNLGVHHTPLGLPMMEEIHAYFMLSIQQDRHPAVDRSRFRRCRANDIEFDLRYVSIAVTSFVQKGYAFYIGATTREPEERWYGVGSDRAGPGQSVKHCERWLKMCVVLVGTSAQIADRETAAIRMYSQDRRIRNRTDAAVGYNHQARRAFLYLCYGSAAHADKAQFGGVML